MELRRVYPKEQVIEVAVKEPEIPVLVGRGTFESSVYQVEVECNGKRLPLLRKRIDNSQLGDDHVLGLLDKHRRLKLRRIPTVPLMFQSVQDPKEMYVSDLTHGGQYLCFSANDWDVSSTGRLAHRHGDQTKYTVANPEETVQRFFDLMDLTLQRGVLLHHCDLYFLMVNQETHMANPPLVGDVFNTVFSPNDCSHPLAWQRLEVARALRITFGLLDVHFVDEFGESFFDPRQVDDHIACKWDGSQYYR